MRRTGYSYVEMLLVITMIGILVALLLPAVQAAREAARRCQCTRNLTQLHIAVQNYELHHGVYPPGTIDKQGPILSQPVGYHHNWISQILPYLEQKVAYQHIDRSVGVYHANNVPVRRLEFSVLRCPSSPRRGRGYSDYAGVHSSVEVPIDVDNDGVFFLNSRIRYEDVPDGSTNTIFIGEKLTLIGDLGWMSGTRATLRNVGLRTGGFPGAGVGAFSVKRADSMPKRRPWGVDTDFVSDAPLQDEELLDLLVGPASSAGMMYSTGVGTWGTVIRPKDARLAVGGFESVHPGGTQFALGDGSCRFLSTTADQATLSRLARRADGQLLGDY